MLDRNPPPPCCWLRLVLQLMHLLLELLQPIVGGLQRLVLHEDGLRHQVRGV